MGHRLITQNKEYRTEIKIYRYIELCKNHLKGSDILFCVIVKSLFIIYKYESNIKYYTITRFPVRMRIRIFPPD